MVQHYDVCTATPNRLTFKPKKWLPAASPGWNFGNEFQERDYAWLGAFSLSPPVSTEHLDQMRRIEHVLCAGNILGLLRDHDKPVTFRTLVEECLHAQIRVSRALAALVRMGYADRVPGGLGSWQISTKGRHALEVFRSGIDA